jgi:hypothetical protein
MKIISVGCPCTCRPGRYVRFFIPPGVPGCEPVISCRGVESAREDVQVHEIPRGALIAFRLPEG